MYIFSWIASKNPDTRFCKATAHCLIVDIMFILYFQKKEGKFPPRVLSYFLSSSNLELTSLNLSIIFKR